MIDPAGRLHNLAATQTAISDGAKSEPSKSQSFTTAFSDELAQSMTKAGETESLPVSSALSQQSAARRDLGTTSRSTSSDTPQLSGINGLVPSTASSATTNPTSGAPSGTASGTPDSSNSSESFDNAYWASQPAAVQQLQNIQDPTERTEVATQLAQEGYTIDVPIMVWGWDPQLTTQLRQADGYTWVPSALQQPIEAAPGISAPGVPSYNPANPPAGSIMV